MHTADVSADMSADTSADASAVASADDLGQLSIHNTRRDLVVLL